MKLLKGQNVLRENSAYKDRKKSDDLRKKNIQDGDIINGKIYAAGLYWDTEVVKLNWQEAMEYAARKGMRLPTKDELLAGFNSGNQALRNPADYYWSATTYANDTSSAWLVNFYGGYAYAYGKTSISYARCVSTGP
jgi:formylglycine-generating enzyme required for sulfatase activity